MSSSMPPWVVGLTLGLFGSISGQQAWKFGQAENLNDLGKQCVKECESTGLYSDAPVRPCLTSS